jgi:hypothetical protein
MARFAKSILCLSLYRLSLIYRRDAVNILLSHSGGDGNDGVRLGIKEGDVVITL